MKIQHALLALVATACGGTTATGKGSGDTSSTLACTTLDSDEPTIDTVSASCDAAGQNIVYDVRTTALTGDGYVWAVGDGAPPWDEIHPIIAVDFDPCGSYDHLRLQVTATGDITQYEEGKASGFGCDAVEGGDLTYAFAIRDQNDVLVDCKVAGHNPDGVVTGAYAAYAGTGPDPIDLTTCVKTTLAR